MLGYNAMPDRTVEAWRDFWLHTGDGGRQDQDGYFYFVDRIKDTIRRRAAAASEASPPHWAYSCPTAAVPGPVQDIDLPGISYLHRPGTEAALFRSAP